MYNVNVPFTTGNFDLDITIKLKEEVVEKFVKNGVVYVVQRDGASKAYLTLKGEENDKGKLQLPKDFERKSVEYSEENLQAMVEAFSKALAPYGEATITGSEHVSGAEVSPMKRATEFVDSLLGNAQNEEQLRGFLGMYENNLPEDERYKVSPADADRDDLIAIANKHGVGKAKPKA